MFGAALVCALTSKPVHSVPMQNGPYSVGSVGVQVLPQGRVVNSQPVLASRESVVKVLPSLQMGGAPPLHPPARHRQHVVTVRRCAAWRRHATGPIASANTRTTLLPARTTGSGIPFRSCASDTTIPDP